MAFSQSGKTFAISTTPQPADLNVAAFAALTYTTVGGVGSIGETGFSTNIISYDTLANDVVSKAKGMTDAGSPPIEVARIAGDPGQIAMRLAGAVTNHDNYAFKIVFQDGTIQYLRGLVTGPTRPGGRNEDFELEVYTLALNQPEVIDNNAST